MSVDARTECAPVEWAFVMALRIAGGRGGPGAGAAWDTEDACEEDAGTEEGAGPESELERDCGAVDERAREGEGEDECAELASAEGVLERRRARGSARCTAASEGLVALRSRSKTSTP